jgi:mannose-6-phosphate isomerase-like protein (cupin superfamily)
MSFIDPRRLTEKELLPGWTARFFHSERMTFSYTEVAAGGQVHRHHHPEEEVWHIIDGAAEITLGHEVRAAAA